MWKFRNYEDYVQQRNEMIDRASAAIEEGNTDEYNARVADVESMDNQWAADCQNRANLNALRNGAPSAPMTIAPVAGFIINEDANDQDMEYRMSFMNHVLKGAPMMNASGVTTTTDAGAVIPTTIINRIVEKMESVGGIYAKLTKTYYKGGVQIPTSAVKPVATWTSESGTSDKQKKSVGKDGMISFTYHKLRCVVGVSLEVDTMTLPVFEETLSKNIADAMVKAIEYAAFNGSGSGQPLGVLNVDVPEERRVEIEQGKKVTYADINKAEGAIPSEYEVGTEWYMKKTTFFNEISAMVDANGQPIAKVNTGTNGKPEYRILGRLVTPTDHMPAFAEGNKFAVAFNFENFVFNTNLQITIKEYEDTDTDDKYKKAVMLADGKPVDTNGLVVMLVKNA